MAEKNTIRDYHWEVLMKEIDLIDTTIRNLDDIIFKTKNFAFVLWGGSLYLIVEQLSSNPAVNVKLLVLLTALIPLIFWMMDFQWRRHLLNASAREKIISQFLNSDAFDQWIMYKEEPKKHFPIYDPVGWIYTRKAQETEQLARTYDNKYLTNPKANRFGKILFYKDAKLFYPVLMIVSIVFGLLYSSPPN